jgi:DNA-binding transcriptional ArsR family regulator
LDQLLDPKLFKAVAEPTRAALLCAMIKCGRECTVTEAAAATSVDFSVVARHLAALARAGMLEVRRSGREVWYRPRCMELCDRLRRLIAAIEEWCPNQTTGHDGAEGCCDASSSGAARKSRGPAATRKGD